MTNAASSITSKTTSLTTSLVMDAANLTMDAAKKTTQYTNNLVSDAAALAFDREERVDEEPPETLPPLSISSCWAPLDDNHLYLKREDLEQMVSKVDGNIRKSLNECAKRAEAIRAKEARSSDVNVLASQHGLHVMYTRAISCILFPHTPGSQEEVSMWTQDDYNLLREWCGKCDDRVRVTEHHHHAAMEFLDSFDGKGALMAGLNERLRLVNQHPFYDREQFTSPEDYESWKIYELSAVERQKQVLVKYNKTELIVDVLDVRAVENVNQDSGERVGSMASILKKPISLTTQFGRAFAEAPVSSVVRATGAMVLAPTHFAKAMVATRSQIWSVVSFATYQHKSEMVGDILPEEPVVSLNDSVTWQVRPHEKGAVCIQLWRKKKYVVSIKASADEVLGSVMFCWEELHHAAEVNQPIEGWFQFEDGSYDEKGHPCPGGREVKLKIQLVTKPIDGTEEQPLLDPVDELHKVYTDFYRALNPGLSMMPPPGVDWLLKEMRLKCGIGESWHHLLRLSPGLNLNTPHGLEKSAELEIREGRLVALLECIRGGAAARVGTIKAVEDGLLFALHYIQGQIRNSILRFPYQYACEDGEEEYQEPIELRLLIEIDEAINHEFQNFSGKIDGLLESNVLMQCFSSHLSTTQVVSEGMKHFVNDFYGRSLRAALHKSPPGELIPEGEMEVKHLKKVCKRCEQMIVRLHENFAPVVPWESELSALEALIDLVTVDVLSAIAAYHVRGASRDAFEDGSVEAMLLKLHLRINSLRRMLVELQPSIRCDGLATATGPVLSAWVEKTRENIFRWMDKSMALDQWVPVALESGNGYSSSLIDVFSSAENACRTFVTVRMGALPAVREAFLELLGDVCIRYVEIMNQEAEKEQAAAAQAKKLSTKTSHGLGSMLGLMSFQKVGDLKFMHGVQAIVSSPVNRISGQSAGGSDQGSSKGDDDQGAHEEKTWEERGEEYLEKMEHLADELASVSAWKKNLGALGKKSLQASISITKKTASLATFGKVGVKSNGSSSTVTEGTKSESKPSKQPKKKLTSQDFFDGQPLVARQACPRISNAMEVKGQLDNLIAILEQDPGFLGGEGCHQIPIDMDDPFQEHSKSDDWTLSPRVLDMYNRVRVGVEDSVEVELRPLLQWLATTIAAALTEEAGSSDDGGASAREACLAAKFFEGQKVIRGPDWKWGRQDGWEEDMDSPPTGLVTLLKPNGWCKVLWEANGHEDSYRCGAEGDQFDVQPLDLELPEPPLPPAVAAIEDALEATLAALRESLSDKGFMQCLRVIWLACVSVLETCLHDDLTGNRGVLLRARALAERLKNYMHAGGDGVSMTMLDKSSMALMQTIEASLM